MTSQFSRRCGQDPLRLQAQAAAQAIIAQGRQAAQQIRDRQREPPVLSAPLEDAEEPMSRYVRVFSRPAVPSGCPCRPAAGDTALLERAVEALTEQNQLLADLLAAVNSLTAATLGIQARLSG